jgi:hypothetical protein
MAKKWGEDFVSDQLHRGVRELGGFLYPESNIAQPMYPHHHGGHVAETQPAKESVLDQYPEQEDVGRNDPGIDDHGIDRD